MSRNWWIAFVVALILAVLAFGVWYVNRVSAAAGQLTIWVFAFALGALIPLAALVGEAVETLTAYLGSLGSGLLGASLSNVPELAIGVALLIHARLTIAQAGVIGSDLDVVRGLLIGSVINNILVTLGIAVLIAALRRGPLSFDAGQAAGYASMLALAVVGLALPTLAAGFAAHRTAAAEDLVSLSVGVILLASYVTYIGTSVFGWGQRRQLAGAITHERDAAGERATETERLIASEERDEAREAGADRAAHRAMRRAHRGTFLLALAGLAMVTLVTVAMAGLLVSVTDTVIRNTPLTPLSTGLIIFPIVCNVGEAASTLLTALKGEMTTAMSVAAGSSVQVPLFVTPLLVLVSFGVAASAGGTHSLVLTLIFKPAELIVVGLVTFVYALVCLDGETTWLEGVQLLAFYAMIAITALLLPGR